ncbi:MAG: SIS domain-containing protein [Clostridia bacterium]|nr:SIS domain-containing protein [Clostridia bacterium]
MKYTQILFNNYPSLRQVEKEISTTITLMIEAYRNSKKVLVCGNGGSAADSEHIAGELMKGFLLNRELNDNDKKIYGKYADKLQYGLPCIPLTSFTALSTAIINDNAADMMFAQQIFVLGEKDDVLIALSTSGNSKNVVAAAEVSKNKGMKVISITGCNDSALSDISDITIKIPESETFRIQELTLPVYHAICADIENEFFI